MYKHLFKNKKRCQPPDGHIPPPIDYQQEIIAWNKTVPISPFSKNKLQMRSPQTHPPSPLPVPQSPFPSVEKDSNELYTNKYTIAVDTNGDVVDLPNIETRNDLIESNPALKEQIRNIVKNLNGCGETQSNLDPSSPTQPPMPTRSQIDFETSQKKINELIDQLGDVQDTIENGLRKSMSGIDAIYSINLIDGTPLTNIEKYDLPSEFNVHIERDTTFVEILYTGLYHTLTELIAHKYNFFETVHAQKALDDVVSLMKYRKYVLISYAVLKHRLDHLAKMNPDQAQYSETSLTHYNEGWSRHHFPHLQQYDECFIDKLKISHLSPIELMSLVKFYENFAQLVDIYETGQIINPRYHQLNSQDHDQMTETDLKKIPDHQLINTDQLPSEFMLFPDYDYLILQRDFYSHLIKINPQSFDRKVEYLHPDVYYKRIYIDGTCDPPMTEPEYQRNQSWY
jgi:hypothetical protein